MVANVRALCRIDDLNDGESKAFPPEGGAFHGMFAIRQSGNIYVYRNSCPHIGTPLDWTPGRFLSDDSNRIICATHGAEFRIVDGLCIRGPCRGEKLESITNVIDDGVVLIME